MAKVLLDASAVLVLLQQEPGHEIVRAALRAENCLISAANLSEAAAKLQMVLKDMKKVRSLLEIPNLEVVPVDEPAALKAAELALPGKALGLSLGDRICLATALIEGAEVLTADQAWARLGAHGPKVRLVRESGTSGKATKH